MTETSWRPVGTTPRRGSTAFHAGLQTVAAMFSQNSPETKQNSPVNACMCSTNNKKKRASIVYLPAVNQKRISLK